jgi:hypothetical protein
MPTPLSPLPLDDALDADPFQQPAQVELVPLSRILPDRYQARLAIPPELKNSFFAGEIDCYEAAHRLLIAAEDDPGLFRLVGELRLLGQSIMNERQIEPATGMWIETEGQGGALFLLETGERRFWSLALEAVARQMDEEPLLRVLPEHGTSRQRQVVENFLREDLCAVEMGKAVATMILESLDLYPQEREDELAYYRRALQIKRLPSNTWPEIERVTGFSRPVLYRHLRILSLDDDLLYLATLYRLPESALREIVTSPREGQRRLVLTAIKERQAPPVDSGGAGSSASSPDSASKAADRSHQDLARRAQSLIKQLEKQAGQEGDLGGVASELSALLGPEGSSSAAETFESLAAGLRRAHKRRKQ